TMLGYYPASETEIASGQGLPDSRNNIFQYEYESDSFYCLTGTSVRKGVPTYFVSTAKNTPTAGTCPNYVDPHSSTGDSWTAHPAAEQNEWTSIAFGGGKFVAVSKTGTHRVMTSTDGKNWTSHMAAEQNEWNSITYGNGLFVAVAGNGTNRVMTSPDGVTWSAHSDTQQNRW